MSYYVTFELMFGSFRVGRDGYTCQILNTTFADAEVLLIYTNLKKNNVTP